MEAAFQRDGRSLPRAQPGAAGDRVGERHHGQIQADRRQTRIREIPRNLIAQRINRAENDQSEENRRQRSGDPFRPQRELRRRAADGHAGQDGQRHNDEGADGDLADREVRRLRAHEQRDGEADDQRQRRDG